MCLAISLYIQISKYVSFMDKYVITGISRLTGERVIISSPHSYTKTCEMRDHLAGKTHRYSAYTRLKVEPLIKYNRLW